MMHSDSKFVSLVSQSNLILYTLCTFLNPFESVSLLTTCKDVVCAYPWDKLVRSAIAKGKRIISDSTVDFSISNFFATLSKGISDVRPPTSQLRRSIWTYVHQINFLEIMRSRMDAAQQAVTRTAFGSDAHAFRLGLLVRLFLAFQSKLTILCVRCKKSVRPHDIGRHLIIARDRLWRPNANGFKYKPVLDAPGLYKPIQRALGFAALDSHSYLASIVGSTLVPCLCHECATLLAHVVDRNAFIDFEDVLFMGEITTCAVTDIIGSASTAQSFAVVAKPKRRGVQTYELALSPGEAHCDAREMSKATRLHEARMRSRCQAIESLGNTCWWIEKAFIPLYVDQILLPVWNTYIGNVDQGSVLQGDILVNLCDVTVRAERMISNFDSSEISADLAKSEIPREVEIVELVRSLLHVGKCVQELAKVRTDKFVSGARIEKYTSLVQRARGVLEQGGMLLDDINMILGSSVLSFLTSGATAKEMEVRSQLNAMLEKIRSRGQMHVQGIDDYLAAFAQFDDDDEHLALTVDNILTAVTPIPECGHHVCRNLPVPPPVRPPVWYDPAVYFNFEHDEGDEGNDDDMHNEDNDSEASDDAEHEPQNPFHALFADA